MTDEEIKKRLSDFEDGWTERKQQGVSTDDVRKALVAFANSVPDGEEAILFIGVSDKGQITGVDNVEKRQKSFIRTATEWCYPPIKYTTRVLETNGANVIAFIVQSSFNKPHFAGPAFIRVGNVSKESSETAYNQLIASRNSKARPLLEAMRTGERVIVFNWTYGRDNRLAGAATYECTVIECTPHYVVFKPLTDNPVSADYERITLKRNFPTNQLQVDIDG